MASVHIGIGHDDNLVVTQLTEIHSLLSVFILLRHSHAECGIDITDFLTVERPVFCSFLHVQNLTSKRKDSLDATVTSLLCSTACGISLDEEELALFRISFGAVCKFTRHTGTGHYSLALNHFTRLSGSVSGCGGENDFLYDNLRILRIFFEVLVHSC